jgi:GNAT superfamily N-acetyltransferase
MDSRYTFRKATIADAATIARHRGWMFLEMQSISLEQSVELIEHAEPWVAGLLARGQYQGWLVEEREQVAAGAGLHLWKIGPQPGCLRVGKWAHVANVYTMPAHRRCGLAKNLMQEMLIWSRAEGIDQITLSPSQQAHGLYESLGFAQQSG